mmetsp:Transcript_15474/g.27143  ORF Transcript_15474/g.27143 Transcript_15474/m.27143 type:complete len:320 (-) Transcript_15474:188-1147(-)|eukprot:CAMPEP_0197636174 /NCGR_PEP_ID=MMETSP1338-20131121/11766_1 /TAXON_ID=43686 ORGANISM="Pelagodinium beii, Strain RCC1491" /NCGR_SAMPLE_ID=MMETSP1338 /ASSEMBLY_ACC=CAM_ASM_000754 /LENGTH=319 /DNA_ID=CAMNT_0043208363 /DNA_START=41 /DNA_END=1000 /DNA_ORIENTATION=-
MSKSALGKGKGDLATVELHHASGASAQIYLWGATLCSYKTADGKERIFVSPGALFDGKKAIRGGVPLVFPQFGQPDKAMAQHGFARTSFWALKGDIEENAEGVTAVLTLSDSEATRKVWNYPFRLEYIVSLTAASLKMTLRIINTGKAPFSFQTLLHTYFKIPEISEAVVRGLGGRTYIDKVKNGEKTVEDSDISLPSFTDRVYVGKDVVTGNIAKDVTIASKVGSYFGWMFGSQPEALMGVAAISNEGTIAGKAMPLEVVVWNPYEEASPGDLPPPAFKEFVCVEPGLLGQMKGEEFVEKHELPAQAVAELSQKIVPM